MPYETRDNSGSLFVNDKKEKDSHPDRSGKAMIGGVEYYVSGWLKESAGGKKFLSLAFKPVQSSQDRGDGWHIEPKKAKPKPAPVADKFEDDDIPW